MRLQTFYHAKINQQIVDFGIEAIAADSELAKHIQEILIWLKFLDPPADGKFGPISTEALVEFQNVMNLSEEKGFLGLNTAKLLVETSPDKIPQPEVDLSKNNFAARIVGYMLKMNYRVAVGSQKYNIVYVEGINADGSLNSDAPNHFNDRRIAIEIPNGIPIIQQNWEATTEPGTAYTLKPMAGRAKELGAARIAFGQYKAWQVGTHYGSGAEPHEALVQVSPISVYRDKNKDQIRTGDYLDTGLFDINQHYGYDYPRNDIGYASAGCLVGRLRAEHREFMALIKKDKRYQLNQQYRFLTTVIAGNDLAKHFPA